MVTSDVFPVNAEQLTEEWLSRVMWESGVLPRDGRVAGFSAKAMGFENGLVGSLVRLSLAYSPARMHGPRLLVAKFSPLDDARRQTIGAFGMFEREVRFYKELAPRVGVSVPACYFAAFDPETQHSVILLEDLSGNVGDDEAGCNPLMAQRAIEAMAALHARWWRSPALAALTWLRRGVEANSDAAVRVRERYPTFRERFGHAVPDHLWQPLLDRVAIEPPPVVPGPATLIHGDASSKNMCFNNDGSVTLFDWQLAGESAPAHDVATFLIAGMNSSDRRSSQRELLNAYHAALTENGVTDYSVEQCARDVRLAAMTRVRGCIFLGGAPAALAMALRITARAVERNGAFFEDGGADVVPI